MNGRIKNQLSSRSPSVFLLEMQRQAELIGHLCNEPVAGG